MISSGPLQLGFSFIGSSIDTILNRERDRKEDLGKFKKKKAFEKNQTQTTDMLIYKGMADGLN